ncbi:hypothetical protein PsorP6_014727 [Peronosclerospora sorghi]|uniref:Uncharacterized protein n=1 Tax=Peronosclerospora sorghi TaxID=230839 RepID=A0ACC0VT18_9STRA|nr:hypothetical protein PsorP6_014727 [Peronosclerospora sorghi]
MVLGDSHIPTRASEIPKAFQKILVPNKVQHVLCTGNLVTKEEVEMLQNWAPNVYVVAGDCDPMNVDILVTGHTHTSHIRTEQGKWFVNPGSITGAFSTCARDVIPSFMLMALQGPKVVVFLYELKGGNVVVSKSEFTKDT